ncbi:hypothetical protein HU200_022905 [Digitaria exilis]|uniref:Uncharacterized protein n=1 Tax=Digitaria exilis TaxID=1010633 RepID=A0A835C4K3_9POAL|nr:hypothetical protein HU200_022905 [Digitaria exilis]
MRYLAALLVPLFLVLTLAVVSVPVASAAVAGVPPTSAPWVANFSLMIHALVFRDYLDLVEVVSGSVQVAGVGNNYSLLLRAADRNATVGRDWNWMVISFRRVAGN